MSMYEIITAKSAPVIPKDAIRRRVMPKAADLEATLAAMKADAAAWKARKADAWGEGMAVKPERLTRDERIFWTPEKEAALADEIVRVLRNNGPMARFELQGKIRQPHNRNKLAKVMFRLKEAGRIVLRQTSNRRKEWSAV